MAYKTWKTETDAVDAQERILEEIRANWSGYMSNVSWNGMNFSVIAKKLGITLFSTSGVIRDGEVELREASGPARALVLPKIEAVVAKSFPTSSA